MKKLAANLIVSMTLICMNAGATNYYFSSSTGDDARSTTQARNSSTPWRTIGKLNSFFISLLPGDSVLFKRGDSFSGEIIVNKSGTSTANIVLGAYGSGARPVISGFVTVSTWTSIGSGIYESVVSSAQSTLNMVTRNNAFQPIGRWPKVTASNSGYLAYQSHSGTTSITSNALAGALNYVGGEVVIRANHYSITRGLISAQGSATINYSLIPGGLAIEPLDGGYGFFFQNHVRTLTTLGEWCYEASTKKLKMYFGSYTPSSYSIKASVIPNNVTISSKSYVIFDNLSFTGSNSKAFNITGSTYIQIRNCDISFAGMNGIAANSACNHLTVYNTILSSVNNNGIDANYATYWSIRRNTFTNIGVTAGMGASGNGQFGTSYVGDYSVLEYNSLTNAGYHGFHYVGGNITIQYNFISNFCLTKDDGGGIYTYKNTSAGVKTIKNNIVMNGIGAPAGTPNGIAGGGALGIYSDGASNNVQVLNNSVANIQQVGIVFNDAQNAVLTGNTVFNSGSLVNGAGSGGQLQFTHWSGGQGIRNVTMTNNIFVAKLAQQGTGLFYTPSNDISLFFASADYNYYARPMNDYSPIFNRVTGPVWLTLAQWQVVTGKELHSKKSPKTITNVNSLRFEYNASESNKVINLGAAYIDIKGTSYPSSITLAPYTSAVLILASGATTQAVGNTAEVLNETSIPLANTFKVYPNPVNDNVTLEINNGQTGKMNVQIVNMAGMIIRNFIFNKDQQINTVNLPASDLPVGVYFVHVQIGDWADRRKIVKL